MIAKNHSRILNIELLRGIASLGVCIVHLQMFSGYMGPVWLNKLINAGQLGVYLFFIVSGFIMPYSLYKNQYRLKNFFKFLFKRNLRIDPPYYIALIITIIFMHSEHFNKTNFIYNIFYLVPFVKNSFWYDTLYWTLGIEMQFYILLGLTFPLFKCIKPWATVVILLISFHSVIFIQFGHGREYIIENLPYFIIGAISFMVYERLIDFRIGLIILIIICIEFSFLLAIRYTIISIPAVLLILVLKPISNKISLFFGRISYSLYLTHILVAFISYDFLFNLGLSPMPILAFQLSLSIIVAFAYSQYIERHFIKISKKIAFKINK